MIATELRLKKNRILVRNSLVKWKFTLTILCFSLQFPIFIIAKAQSYNFANIEQSIKNKSSYLCTPKVLLLLNIML